MVVEPTAGVRAMMSGAEAVARAVQACRPGVISAYPITPQTHIVESLARMVAEGDLAAEFVRVESEFSAASVVYGASATGVRAYTASSSQGLLLMTEVLYNMASTRLPVVITGANRAISAPITIQPDHQDTISLRDTGMIQLYVENAQEAHDTHIQAFKIAEDPAVLLPVMVCVEGFLITHTWEPVAVRPIEMVDRFLPPYRPVHPLDPEQPVSYGCFADDNLLTEFRYAHHRAVLGAGAKVEAAAREFRDLGGSYFGGLLDEYRTEGAEVIVVAMGSVLGTLRDAVDELRAEGVPVGAVKVRCYRPFPAAALEQALRQTRVVAVLDANLSPGHQGALASDLKAALYNRHCPPVLAFAAGLGGREVGMDSIRQVVDRCRAVMASGRMDVDFDFLGLRPEQL